MTIDIDSLRALADAASPGPWEDGTASCCPDMGWVDGPKGVVCPVYQGTKVTHTLDANDAAFIAAARAAVPALLDEVERLRRDRDSYANSDFERQLSDERAEVERLRAELGHLRKHVEHNDEEYKTMKAVLRSVHGVYQAALVWRDMTAFANSTADDRLMRAIDTATKGDSHE